MGKSIFRKDPPEKKSAPPDPYALIDKEVDHLKKGSSVRHGEKGRRRTPNLLIVLAFCGLLWLYLMDPICHAWYKGDAVKAYLYLHSFGSAADIESLASCRILTEADIDNLNHRTGNFQDYYASPDAAKKNAQDIVEYMKNVQLLHDGKYLQLDPVGRMRYAIFIKFGIVVPTDWTFLDPTVGP